MVFTKDIVKKLLKKFGTISRVKQFGKSDDKFHVKFEPSKEDKNIINSDTFKVKLGNGNGNRIDIEKYFNIEVLEDDEKHAKDNNS